MFTSIFKILIYEWFSYIPGHVHIVATGKHGRPGNDALPASYGQLWLVTEQRMSLFHPRLKLIPIGQSSQVISESSIQSAAAEVVSYPISRRSGRLISNRLPEHSSRIQLASGAAVSYQIRCWSCRLVSNRLLGPPSRIQSAAGAAVSYAIGCLAFRIQLAAGAAAGHMKRKETTPESQLTQHWFASVGTNGWILSISLNPTIVRKVPFLTQRKRK